MGITRLKSLIFKLTPKRVLDFYQAPVKKKRDAYATLSYSQEGEDLILKRIFEGKKGGFFIDVGAHHPKRFSNTYLLYKLGWRGINIDAMPGSMDEFKRIRPEDINLEVAISDKVEELDYFIFNENALNTFSKEEARKKDSCKGYKIKETRRIKTSTLSDILNKYSIREIDFLTIDVEGYDFKVLKSLNLKKFKPTVILIESLNSNIVELEENEIYQFLKRRSYYLLAKTFNTLIFKKL